MKVPKLAVVLSCEHGGNVIPEQYASLFKEAADVINSHRGYDIGALELYNCFKNKQVVFNQCATVSRLVVDVNRSLYRKSLFSEFTKALPASEKESILNGIYYAFRNSFKQEIYKLWEQNRTVLHLSVHSFKPELNGVIRQTDFGILYHPGRMQEKQFAKVWKSEIEKVLPGFRTRFNYPFQGKPDGHVRFFRDKESEKYLGLEFEMNQKYAGQTNIYKVLTVAFENTLNQF
ncbi:MAG: N-formylglutamate amidohydrolase [Marinilabiliaceae bacterium]|nr:N-formylglutamate amidohydrolase [Marinilabiliaceae bacterium]